jgi:hypothetical protein
MLDYQGTFYPAGSEQNPRSEECPVSMLGQTEKKRLRPIARTRTEVRTSLDQSGGRFMEHRAPCWSECSKTCPAKEAFLKQIGFSSN